MKTVDEFEINGHKCKMFVNAQGGYVGTIELHGMVLSTQVWNVQAGVRRKLNALFDTDFYHICQRQCESVADMLEALTKFKEVMDSLGKTKMPWGKYGPLQGDHRILDDIPADYFLWYRDQVIAGHSDSPDPLVMTYIRQNLEALKKDAPDYIVHDEK